MNYTCAKLVSFEKGSEHETRFFYLVSRWSRKQIHVAEGSINLAHFIRLCLPLRIVAK